MIPGISSASFYNHQVDLATPTSPAEAARILLVAMTFGLSGTCHPQKDLYFTQAPGVGGVHFLLEGKNLFQTLALNLLQYDSDHPDTNLSRTDRDKPAWEMDDPFTPERQRPLGYLDYLTWQNRRVKLIPENENGKIIVRSAISAPGLRLAQDILDPFKNYRLDEKTGWRATSFSEQRALWRDSSSLFQIHNLEKRPPLPSSQTASLLYEYESQLFQPSFRYRYLALGLLHNQAKVEFQRAERVPIRLEYLQHDDLVLALDTALAKTEQARRALYFSIRKLADLIISYQSDLNDGRQANSDDSAKLINHWGYENLFWGNLQTAFSQLIYDTPEDQQSALSTWYAALHDAAWQSLEHAVRMAGETPAALKAAVRARTVLAGGLKKTLEISE